MKMSFQFFVLLLFFLGAFYDGLAIHDQQTLDSETSGSSVRSIICIENTGNSQDNNRHSVQYLFETLSDSEKTKWTKRIMATCLSALSTQALTTIFTNDIIVQTFFTTADPKTYGTLAAFMYTSMFLPEIKNLFEAMDQFHIWFREKKKAEMECKKKHFTSDITWFLFKSVVSAGLTYKSYQVFYNATFGFIEPDGHSLGGPGDYVVFGPYLLSRFLQAMSSLDSEAMSLTIFHEKLRHHMFQNKDVLTDDRHGLGATFQRAYLRGLRRVIPQATAADELRWEMRQQFSQAYRKVLSLQDEDLISLVERIRALERDGQDKDLAHQQVLRTLYELDQEGDYKHQTEPTGYLIARYAGMGLAVAFSPLYWLTGYAAANGVTGTSFDDDWGNGYAAPMTIYTAALTAYMGQKIAGRLYAQYAGTNPNLWNEEISHMKTSVPGLRTIVASLSYGLAGLVSVPVAGLGAAKVAYACLGSKHEKSLCKKWTEVALMGAAGYANLAFKEIDGAYQEMVTQIAKRRGHDPAGFLRDGLLEKIVQVMGRVSKLKDNKARELYDLLRDTPLSDLPSSPKEQPLQKEDPFSSTEPSADPSPDRPSPASSESGTGESLMERLLPESEGGVPKAPTWTAKMGIKARNWFLGRPPEPALIPRIEALIEKPASFKAPAWASRLGTRLRNVVLGQPPTLPSMTTGSPIREM